MGLKSESVDGEKRTELAALARHHFEQFAAVVDLAKQANAVLNHARLAAEAACHFLLLEMQGVVVRDANPMELVQEVRKAARDLKKIDEGLLVVLNQVVQSGNLGSHFEPMRKVEEETLEGARVHVRGIRKWIDERFPMTELATLPRNSETGIRFALIRLTRTCLWIPAVRLDRVPSEVRIAFHAMGDRQLVDLGVDVTSRTTDPVFDVALQNFAKRPTIVHRLGVLPHKLWSSLKGMPSSRPLATLGRYQLPLQKLEEGCEQWLELDDPIEVPAGTSARIELQLAGFRKAIPSNESVLSLLVGSTDGAAASEMIYLGVY